MHKVKSLVRKTGYAIAMCDTRFFITSLTPICIYKAKPKHLRLERENGEILKYGSGYQASIL